MRLWVAIVLLVLAVAGIALSARGLRQRRALRTACVVLLSLAALVLAAYIGLTFLFVDAVSHQPPVG